MSEDTPKIETNETPKAQEAPETSEQVLTRRYNTQIQQLVTQRGQLQQALARVEDQIKMLQGAILGLNELSEARRNAEQAAAAKVSTDAKPTNEENAS